jgi:hypothetical protein
MPAAERRVRELATAMEGRLASLRRATARRIRLERLFADRAFLDRTLTDGRYLRLCAAIAWASAREEQAREAVETDAMVTRLRESAFAARF